MNIKKNDERPLITLAIPNFNYGRYLDKCITSALDQAGEDVEILISDNCSTDNSWEIINKYSDQRLKIWQQTRNIGLFPNWNNLLENASGKYFKLLQSDDWLEPEFIEGLRSSVNGSSNHKVLAIINGYRIMAEGIKSSKLSELITPINDEIKPEFIVGLDYMSTFKSLNYSMPTLNALNTDVLKSIGGYRPEDAMRADSIAFAKVVTSDRLGKIIFSKKSIGVSRIHANNDRRKYTRFAYSRDEWTFLNEFIKIAYGFNWVALVLQLSVVKGEAFFRLLFDFIKYRNIKSLFSGIKWFKTNKILLSSLIFLPIGGLSIFLKKASLKGRINISS